MPKSSLSFVYGRRKRSAVIQHEFSDVLAGVAEYFSYIRQPNQIWRCFNKLSIRNRSFNVLNGAEYGIEGVSSLPGKLEGNTATLTNTDQGIIATFFPQAFDVGAWLKWGVGEAKF